ncbi:hypothetical protein LMG19083_00711 [Ralstonia psammae]|uniref:Type III effector protein n=1 Tax=Ralstonia psammae TaxID=3058598 RepID=A0ABM9J314_9RALS|nr:hypothetical protein [Ralstonia sp. LMG 19083]CAJ0780831.1 hypothetical protein LMG19083_00711 [Ralstonia sp. LMG 19083]
MPRVDGASSSAVPAPSTGEASTSNTAPRADANLRQRPVRGRDAALADLPAPRANAPRTPAADTAVAEPRRGRMAATLDRVRGAGQALAAAGGPAARAGVRAGAALGQYALEHPLFTGGLGGVALGNYNAYRAQQRNDVHAYVGAASMTVLSTMMLALHTGRAIADLLRANPAPLRVSADMLSDAVNMLNGLDDVDMAAEAGPHTLYVIDHVQDIAAVPANRLHPAVRNAAEQAGGDPQQLIRNLVGVLTGHPPVYSPRRPAPVNARPAPADAAPLPISAETLGRAANMLTGFDDHHDLSGEAGPHRLHVINLVRDLASVPAGQLHPAVRQAAEAAGDNALQLVRNLIAAVQRDPSIV